MHPQSLAHLQTLEEGRSLTDGDVRGGEPSTVNGWHSNSSAPYEEKISGVLTSQDGRPPQPHAPQHLNATQQQAPLQHQSNNIDRATEQRGSSSPGTTGLDGELSGLQSAVAKTALVIRGEAANQSHTPGVITFEGEDDEGDLSSHWIFRRHVGFSSDGTGGSAKLPCRGGPLHTQLVENGSDMLPRRSPSDRSAKPPIQADEVNGEIERTQLLLQLNTLRRKRQHLQRKTSPNLALHAREWDARLSSARRDRAISMSRLEAASARRMWTEEGCQSAMRWHVLGDVFCIWYRGPFGTMNGFRLGRSATTSAGLMKLHAGGRSGNESGGGSRSAAQETAGSGSGGGGLFSWGGSSDNSAGAAANANSAINNGSGSAANARDAATPEKVVIPWTEINSALGQIAFLLYTLQHNSPHSGISFQKHVIQPCGGVSKIGVLKSASGSHRQQKPTERRRITALAAYMNAGSTTQTATNATTAASATPQSSMPLPGEVTWYNLHHYEENGSLLSMGYYARRNFNAALEGLLHCIAEACAIVEARDMALAAPYVMRVDGLVVGKDARGTGDGILSGVVDGGGGSSNGRDHGEATVGGLPVTYDPAAGEQWTAVCKYLLTNLKWLVAFSAKHVDR